VCSLRCIASSKVVAWSLHKCLLVGYANLCIGYASATQIYVSKFHGVAYASCKQVVSSLRAVKGICYATATSNIHEFRYVDCDRYCRRSFCAMTQHQCNRSDNKVQNIIIPKQNWSEVHLTQAIPPHWLKGGPIPAIPSRPPPTMPHQCIISLISYPG
jgi:hypothetical protein